MASKVIKVSSLVLLIVFFLPFVSVSCGSEKMEISLKDLTFGMNIGFQKVEGNPTLIVYLLIPLVVAIVAFAVKKQKPGSIIALLGSLIYLFLLFAQYMNILESQDLFMQTNIEIGAYLALILNVVIFIASIVGFSSKNNNIMAPASNSNDVNEVIDLRPEIKAPPNLYLYGSFGIYSGQKFPVKDKIVMGRDTSKCNIIFPENTKGVSAVHCSLINEQGVIYIMDLGSTFGTFLDSGEKLAPNAKRVLKHGNGFVLAENCCGFKLISE